MKKLIFSALLLGLLAACASKEVKEEPKQVEEKPAVQQEAPKPMAKPVEKAVEVKPAPQPAALAAMPSQRSIHYDFDKSVIKDDFKPVVESNARYLNDRGDLKITIEGNCDERGSREYNLALGQRRADSVRKALGVLGVADSRIDTISYGEEKPRCSDHNEPCWSQNRRSDIKY